MPRRHKLPIPGAALGGRRNVQATVELLAMVVVVTAVKGCCERLAPIQTQVFVSEYRYGSPRPVTRIPCTRSLKTDGDQICIGTAVEDTGSSPIAKVSDRVNSIRIGRGEVFTAPLTNGSADYVFIGASDGKAVFAEIDRFVGCDMSSPMRHVLCDIIGVPQYEIE